MYNYNNSAPVFSFGKSDIPRLVEILGIPNVFITDNRLRTTGQEALCMLLRRFIYPNRQGDLAHMFGRPRDEISRIVNQLSALLFSSHEHLLHFDPRRLTPECLEGFAEAISRKGAPLDRCWGFIDGTVRPICRPGEQQRQTYNGHKRIHALKFQSVVTPDGIIVHLSGPWIGRRHDARMLRESNLMGSLSTYSHGTDGEPMYLYGDPAYGNQRYLISPFRGHLTPEQQLFNKQMSAVRECVEWQFGKLITQFAFLDFKKNLKLWLQPVGRYYLVGGLLANLHTCFYGSQTSSYFDMDAPSPELYLGR
jgi:nuclease HARBI1